MVAVLATVQGGKYAMSLLDDMQNRHGKLLKKAENRLKRTKRRQFRHGERQDPLERLQKRLEQRHKRLGLGVNDG